MENLSLLTIVVPTFNRQNFALRQINFWKLFPVKLIVLDGTEKAISEEKLSGLPENIRYIHMPVSIEDRFFKATKLIESPYAMLLGDDEFYIPSAISKCINELENDQTIISCMGLAAMFWHGPSRKILAKDVYTRLRNYEVTQVSASERMIYHMNPYVCSTIYSVMRTENWKMNMNLIARRKYSSPIASELQFELGTCAQGGSKVIDSLQWLRSGENPPTTAKGWDRSIDFLTWYKAERYATEIKDFMSDFALYFESDLNDVTLANVKVALDAHKNFLLKLKNRKSLFNLKKILFTVMRRLLVSSLPGSLAIARKLKNHLDYYLFSRKELTTYASGIANEQGINVDYDALKTISEILTKFRASNS